MVDGKPRIRAVEADQARPLCGQSLTEQISEYRDCDRMVATHGGETRLSIRPGSGARLDRDERRQAVSDGRRVGPKPRSAAVAVSERVDPYPLAVHQGTQSDYTPNLGLGRRLSAHTDRGVDPTDGDLDLALEVAQLQPYVGRGDTSEKADRDLITDELGEAIVGVTHLARVVRHRERDLVVQASMPVLGDRDRRGDALVRGADYRPQDGCGILQDLSLGAWRILAPWDGHLAGEDVGDAEDVTPELHSVPGPTPQGIVAICLALGERLDVALHVRVAVVALKELQGPG